MTGTLLVAALLLSPSLPSVTSASAAVPLVSTVAMLPGPDAPPAPPRPRSLQSIITERVGKVMMTSSVGFMLLGIAGGVAALGAWAVASMGILGPVGLPVTVGVVAAAAVAAAILVTGLLMAPTGVAMNIAGQLMP